MNEFEQAVSRAAKAGSVHADDPDLMAAFCQYDLQRIVGAVSPKLVWEGARRQGLTSQELATLAGRDPLAIDALQWL